MFFCLSSFTQVDITSYVNAVTSEVEEAKDSSFTIAYTSYLNNAIHSTIKVRDLKRKLSDTSLSQAKLAYVMRQIESIEEKSLLDKHTFYESLRTNYDMEVVARIYLIDQINLTAIYLNLELK